MGMISTTNMASHLRSHEEHVCDKCGKSFPSQAKLRHHEEDVHEDGHFVCDECGKVCNSQRILNTHQKQHKVVKVPTPCTVQGCKFVCSSKQTLLRHLQTHKPKNERTTYPCKYCPKFYFSRKVRDEQKKEFIWVSKITNVINVTPVTNFLWLWLTIRKLNIVELCILVTILDVPSLTMPRETWMLIGNAFIKLLDPRNFSTKNIKNSDHHPSASNTPMNMYAYPPFQKINEQRIHLRKIWLCV